MAGRRLGVAPIINCVGSMTSLGGSIMHPAAVEAHTAAAASFLDMNKLLAAAGERVAQLVRAPRGYGAHIVTGAAAGLAASVASCMAGTDKSRISCLPHDAASLPRHVVVVDGASDDRWHQTLQLTGATLRKVGAPGSPMTKEGLRAAIRSRSSSSTAADVSTASDVACILYFAGAVPPDQGPMPLDDILKEARFTDGERIPVIVDAAALLPPRSNLWHFTRDVGVDAVVFSGGKAIRGPQVTGMVIGRDELIAGVRANGSPHEETVCRAMKVSKENIAAFVAALEAFVEGSDDEELAGWESIVDTVVKGLSGQPGIVGVRRVCPGPPDIQPNHIPRVYIDLPPGDVSAGAGAGAGSAGFTGDSVDHGNPMAVKPGTPGQTLAYHLANGEPRIAINTHSAGVLINPQTLTPDEAAIVVRRIKEEAAALQAVGGSVRSRL